MARLVEIAVLVTGLCLSSCSDEGEGAYQGSCPLRTTGLSGEGPGCTNSLECDPDEWLLECDGANTGTCTCLFNGVEEKTIPYDDAYCPADFSTADFDAHEAAAAEACGWP